MKKSSVFTSFIRSDCWNYIFFLDHIWYRYLKKKQNNQKIYYDDKNYKKDKKRVRNNHIF